MYWLWLSGRDCDTYQSISEFIGEYVYKYASSHADTMLQTSSTSAGHTKVKNNEI